MYHIKIDEQNVIIDATSFYVDDYIHTNLDVIPNDIIQGYYKWENKQFIIDQELYNSFLELQNQGGE